MKMRFNSFVAMLFGTMVLAATVQADAPLKSKLDLDVEQARQVAEIEKDYRKQFRSTRGDFNRESRKLRRARSANDSATIARQEETIAELRQELVKVRRSTDEQIRKVLTAEQNEKFDAYIEQRKAMVGSSRDSTLSE